MAWIKRNLFLVVGGLLAVILLGLGVYYFWTNQQKNRAIEAQLEENKATLTRLVNQDPTPNRTNIARAKQEFEKARAAVEEAKLFFQPIAYEPVTGQAFKSLLDQTIFDLQRKANQMSVALPSPQYAFTFAHQKMQLQFPAEAFPALPQQLAEIRTICDVLFDAKVNRLVAVRRSRLYSEEPVSQVDHHEMNPNVNQTAGIGSNPYEVTVHAFTPELAVALESFYKSTNGLVVKAVQVEVAPAPAVDPNAPGPAQPVYQTVVPGVPTAAVPVRPLPPGARPPGGTARPQETVKTVLNERLLKITMVIDVMRTLPPPTTPGAKKV
jgi:hypothetical protein